MSLTEGLIPGADEDDRGTRPSRTELRTFGLMVGGLVAGIFGLLLPMLRNRAEPIWPWIIGAAFAVPAMVRPELLAAVHRTWTRIGLALGWINNRVILTILFFAVIAPMGLIMRAMGKNPMARRFEPQASTYRVTSRSRSRESMERPF